MFGNGRVKGKQIIKVGLDTKPSNLQYTVLVNLKNELTECGNFLISQTNVNKKSNTYIFYVQAVSKVYLLYG